ncbi:MAG: sigma-70 family RNA polymerase sigma factor [Holophagales bacterium]|nr:sigma-70 family RNA polymerase sigma factor [Holophagales bacterium]
MTDEELVERYLKARDPADFRELVERNGPRVLRLVASILGPFRGADAEEVVQDVFLRAHERLGQFRGEARFSTWLYRIAWSVAVNRTKPLSARRGLR